MSQRFFLPSLADVGSCKLDGVEAHHLMHVLRTKVGEEVELFNGLGLVATAKVAVIGRRDVELQIVHSRRDAPPSHHVILGTAAPKGDRFDWLVEKSTELGVTRIVPLVTARSVVDPRDSKLDKLRQTVIAACKQSGRNHLMELAQVSSWNDFCKNEIRPGASFVAHPLPTASTFSASLIEEVTRSDGSSSIVFAVGPEGGFTDEEVAAAVNCGATLVRLGPLILRIETAGLTLAASMLAVAASVGQQSS